MARSPVNVPSPTTTIRRRRARLIPSSFTLAIWRLRPMWRLLLLAGLGNIAAVLLVCIVPLFTQVALSAGIRGVLSGPADATHIIVNGYAQAPTPQTVASVQDQLSQIIASDMGPYALSSAPQFTVSLQGLSLVGVANGGNQSGNQVQLNGADMTQATQQYPIVAGRLPAVSSADLEIALTQSDATALNAKPGSILHAQLQGIAREPVPLTLRVVGIYLPPPANSSAGRFSQNAQELGPGGLYTALASNQTILTTLATLAAKNQVNVNGPQYGPPQFLIWSYALDSSRISANSLNDVIGRLNKVQTDVSGQLNGEQGLQGVFLNSGAYQALTTFRIQILLLQIPLLLLLLQVIALVLLFVRMMADVLVDRQAEAIATLRSRGATRRQIFNMLWPSVRWRLRARMRWPRSPAIR